MNLEKVVPQFAKTLLEHAVLAKLERGEFTAAQYLVLTTERLGNTQMFVPMLEAGIAAAKHNQEGLLATALENNWRDETGRDQRGLVHPERIHARWRTWYLSSLDILERSARPWSGATYYDEVMRDLVRRNNCYEIAGAILMLEAMIPVEFEILARARDRLFPEKFVARPGDGVNMEVKLLGRLYLDDHVRHDRTYHFPQLLNALAPLVLDGVVASHVLWGISQAYVARVNFYDCAAFELLL